MTATGVNKTYDGTDVATVTLSDDALAGDVVIDSFTTATFADTNVGVGKVVSVSGISISGADASNYNLANTTASTTANITVRSITVTAVTDTKIYDGTTLSSVTPAITSGSLAPGDTANFTETFDTKNVGTDKTLTPSGTVTDGNSGNNYAVDFVNDTTGEITVRSITVTATGVNKTYDGTDVATVTLSDDALAGDVVIDSFTTATFADTNVGVGKVVSVSGISISGADASNYNLANTTASTTANITVRSITVTAVTDTKVYDGTTLAPVTPAITSGSLAPGDMANFTETFDTKNVGTDKTLTPSGTVTDGNSGNNYAVDFVNDTTGEITVRSITVTATGVNKTYDGTDVATVTLSDDALAGDVVIDSFTTATFADTNVGVGKVVSVSGISISGADASNYNLANTTASTTANITVRSITVTAVTDTKVYDGTTLAPVTPAITSGSLAPGDMANFTETFDTKNVGTGKTLTPSGTVTDGNGGLNYTVTFANDTTGVITARAITVTAGSDTKGYDGTTTSSVTPTITSGSLAPGDMANFTETFDTKNVGTNLTLTPSGIVNDGNSGNNYTYTFVPVSTGVITARAITVTAGSATKVYDGTTSSSVTPTITLGSLAPADTANFTETFDTKNVGTGKTLTPSGTVSDGNSGNNYAVTFVPVSTGEITVRSITVTAGSATKVYDGTTTSSVTPVITSGSLAPGDTANFTETFDTKNVGTGKTLTPSGMVSDGNRGLNYTVTFTNVKTGVITAATLTVMGITAADKVYDGGTTATLNEANALLNGVVGSDDVTLHATGAAGTFADPNVADNIVVQVSGLAITGTAIGNYTLTQPTTTADITARAITVTAVTDTKEYDGTTASAATPAITVGTLAPDDTANFTEAFDTKNVGTGKTLTPSGTVTDGNGGLNYTVTFANDTTGVITARAITVTAGTDTKVYDGTTTSAATPTITTGTLAPDDTANFTETFDTKNVGTDKTLTPSGTVTDGNSGNNYAVDFVNDTTGEITVRSITVTATGVNKTYDGTDVATVTLSDDALAGDVVIDSFTTATFADTNVGVGKVVSVSGISISGADASNYNLANTTASTTANITVRSITVTAGTDTKVYDGTTTSAATPAITVGTLALDDTANFTEAFDTKNVGTGKTLTPSGTVTDGNGGLNYTVTFANDTTGVITARAITVTAGTDTKVYDGTTTSAATPTITTGTLATGDTANFTETFDTKNVGTDKTLTPSGTVTDGNGGLNYTVTFANDTTGVITARAITVTAGTDTKVYDGTTTSAATPTITTGTLATGDTANFTETFDTKNVGTDKTLTPSGTVTDGNGGLNYTVTFANDTTGVITARAITVTAGTDTKVYDGMTTSAATPTITTGTLATGDTANFTETFDTKNVGTDKTLTPSGTVTDGNGGLNYTVTFANDTTGVITARAITVTAGTDTKVYDGTTTSAATPAITVGTLAPDDTANFTEAFDTKNVGTDKTLTPSGTVTDGNGGLNYTVTFANDTTGVITARAITVTAGTDTKVYDGTPSSSVSPTVTLGTVAAGDTANFTEAFNNKDLGTGKTLTPSGSVTDGNAGLNYTVTFANDTTGVITAKALTVTGVTAGNKVYDGTTVATVDTSAASLVGVVSGETVTLGGTAVGAFASHGVGPGISVAMSGLTLAGTDAGNYTLTQPTTTANITAATPTVSVTDAGGTYSTDPFPATGASVTGVGTDGTIASFGDPSLSYSYYSGATLLTGAPTAAGSYTVVAHYTSDNANYTNADSSPVSFTIAKADASVLVNGYSGVYDGQAHGASLGHATGIGGVDLSSGVTLGASFTNVPGGTAQWTFSYANYNNQSGNAAIDISKASAVISVTPYSVTYDGAPHTATGTATGVNGQNLSGLDPSGTTHTGAGTYTDSWTFSNPNYNSASGTVVDTINAAPAPQRYRLVKEAVLVPVTKLVKVTELVPVTKLVKVTKLVRVNNKLVKEVKLVDETKLVKETELIKETKLVKKIELVKVYY